MKRTEKPVTGHQVIENIMEDMAKQLIRKREDQILSVLAELGFTFANEIEKANFAKERLSVITNIDDPNRKALVLDGRKPIATWDDTITMSQDGTTFTVKLGKP